jgi:hypothetical protein
MRSTAIDIYRYISVADCTLLYPRASDRMIPHSHSILSIHRNMLIYKRKFFRPHARNPNNDPSNFFAYDSKGKLAPFELADVSATIDEASKAVARLRKLDPGLRGSNLRDALGPYQRSEDLAKYEEGVRKSGLPE